MVKQNIVPFEVCQCNHFSQHHMGHAQATHCLICNCQQFIPGYRTTIGIRRPTVQANG